MKMIQDDKGNTSSMRVTMIFCVIVAAVLSFMLVSTDGDITTGELWLIGMWLLVGVAGKNAGKFIEKMEPPKQ